MQNRMLAQGPLHRTDGILSEAGYALAPIKDYDRGRVKAPRRRSRSGTITWSPPPLRPGHHRFRQWLYGPGQPEPD